MEERKGMELDKRNEMRIYRHGAARRTYTSTAKIKKAHETF